jgi:hypothetical protein
MKFFKRENKPAGIERPVIHADTDYARRVRERLESEAKTRDQHFKYSNATWPVVPSYKRIKGMNQLEKQ